MSDTEYADLRNLRLLKETDAALHVQQSNSRSLNVIAWVPKSQCDYIRRFPKDQAIDIQIPAWLADAKGFNY